MTYDTIRALARAYSAAKRDATNALAADALETLRHALTIYWIERGYPEAADRMLHTIAATAAAIG